MADLTFVVVAHSDGPPSHLQSQELLAAALMELEYKVFVADEKEILSGGTPGIGIWIDPAFWVERSADFGFLQNPDLEFWAWQDRPNIRLGHTQEEDPIGADTFNRFKEYEAGFQFILEASAGSSQALQTVGFSKADFLPFAYHNILEKQQPTAIDDREIDILFSGPADVGRRKHLLESISNSDLRTQSLDLGEDILDQMHTAKIFLHVNETNIQRLDSRLFMSAIVAGTPIITEPIPDESPLRVNDHYIVCKQQNINHTVEDALRQTNLLQKIANAAKIYVRTQMRMVDYLSDVLAWQNL